MLRPAVRFGLTGVMPAEPNVPISVTVLLAGAVPPIQLALSEKVEPILAHSIIAVTAFGENPPEECTKGEPSAEANEERSSLRASLTIALAAESVFESDVANKRSVLPAGERPKSPSKPPKKMSLPKILQSLPKAERSKGFVSPQGAEDAIPMGIKSEMAMGTNFRQAQCRDMRFMEGWGLVSYGDSTNSGESCQRNFLNFTERYLP